ncbi:MAG: hypothetical protein CML13_06870 [Puniceicoccaceae bacterium]|nr:hypothetical protein [Puniceicoccaceae bacterium]
MARGKSPSKGAKMHKMRNIPGVYAFPEYYGITSPGCSGDCEFYEQVLSESKRVLELGSGTGRTLLSISSDVREVVGVDNSPEMLAYLQGKIDIAKYKERISLVESDIRQLTFTSEFDAVSMPYRTFLHLYSPDEQMECLEGVFRALEPGGKFILNFFDPEYRFLADLGSVSGSFRRFREGLLQSGNTLQTWAESSCDPEKQLIDELWIYDEIDQSGDVVRRRYGSFKIRYCFRFEAESLFRRAGFEVESLYGGFSGEPYLHGKEQIWMLRKPR